MCVATTGSVSGSLAVCGGDMGAGAGSAAVAGSAGGVAEADSTGFLAPTGAICLTGGVGGGGAALRRYRVTRPKKPVRIATIPIPIAKPSAVDSPEVSGRSSPGPHAAGAGGHVPITASRRGRATMERIPYTIVTPYTTYTRSTT